MLMHEASLRIASSFFWRESHPMLKQRIWMTSYGQLRIKNMALSAISLAVVDVIGFEVEAAPICALRSHCDLRMRMMMRMFPVMMIRNGKKSAITASTIGHLW